MTDIPASGPLPALVRRVEAAFARELQARPVLSLRGGNALDSYDLPEPYDPALDVPTDDYLERHWWGLAHLDAASWRHYLPLLMLYTLRHLQEYTMATEALLISLRPPDREPPRLASLDAAQEAVVCAWLDLLAFGDDATHQELARTAIEEWWGPGASFRSPRDVKS